jgi:hypothetical protein
MAAANSLTRVVRRASQWRETERGGDLELPDPGDYVDRRREPVDLGAGVTQGGPRGVAAEIGC